MRYIVSHISRKKCELIHRQMREIGTLILFRRIVPFRKKQEQDNFLRKLRHFSDDFYPWGNDRRGDEGKVDHLI